MSDKPQLTESADLKHLAEVSKYMHNVTIPRLYESVALTIREASIPTLVFRTKNVPFAHWRHTKHLWIKAPFHGFTEKRCPHHDNPKFSDEAAFRAFGQMDEVSSDEASQQVMSSELIRLTLTPTSGNS